MSITLYSPNLGADGVTKDVHATINSYGTQTLPELAIEVLAGNDTTRKQKVEALLNTPRIKKQERTVPNLDLLVVERLRMPWNSTQVVVYRTTLRINGSVYKAVCYTDKNYPGNLGYISLEPAELMNIAAQLGKTSTPGVWQSLLQIDRLRRFHF